MTPLDADLIQQSHAFWRHKDPHNRHAGGTPMNRLKSRTRRRRMNEIYRELAVEWQERYPFLLHDPVFSQLRAR